MANISSLIPKTRLSSAVPGTAGTLINPLVHLASLSKAVPEGENYGEFGIRGESEQCGSAHLKGTRPKFSDSLSFVSRKGSHICNVEKLADLFHHKRVGFGLLTQLEVFRVQYQNYGTAAEAQLSNQYPRIDVVKQEKAASVEQNAEVVQKQQIARHVARKDKIKFLVNTLLDMKDSKEAVYGALDAWVAWERNFPIASLKRIIALLEKEHQWHRIIQVIKWMLSKGQGNTMGTYGQLIRALDKDHRAEEAHNIWVKKVGMDLHSVPWQLCRQMISTYYRNNMLDELVKLFKGLEDFDRKPPEKSIVQRVADAYEMLGLLEEKERVLEKYKELFSETSVTSSKKKKKSRQGKRESNPSDPSDANASSQECNS